MSSARRRNGPFSARLALPALLVLAGAVAWSIAAGRRDLARPAVAGLEADRGAELLLAARAAERFGIVYPTIAAGWTRPAFAHPIIGRPPGLDLGARAVRAATAYISPGNARPPGLPAVARAFALGCAALAILAFARLAWIGWGPAAGGAGALLFALSPYMGAYATLPHGEMPALAAVLMALGSALLFRRTRARASAGAAMVWLLAAGCFDWSAFLVVLPLGAIALGGRVLAGRVTRVRPQALGLPDGLAGPLANVLLRREENMAIALSKALAWAALVELVALLAWLLQAGALGALWTALRGGGGALAGGLAPPLPWSPATIGVGGLVIVGLWTLTALARFVTGQAEARSGAVAVLLATGALFPLALPGLARAGFHLPALVAAGAALAAVDLVAVVAALASQRRLVLAEPEPAGAPVLLGLALAGLAAASAPGWRHARAEAATGASAAAADPGERALARVLADTTEVRDRLLALDGFPLPLAFLASIDRDVEILPSLPGPPDPGAVEARARAGEPTVLLLAEPLPAGAAAALAPLLSQHPALRVGRRWLVDLRRFEPGIVCRAPAGPEGALEDRPREALALDAAYGVTPSADALPDLGGGAGLSRAELLTYHNIRPAAAGDAERAHLRAELLAGFAATPRWLDPAPGGQPIGVRYAAHEQRLDVLYECPETALVLPDGVAVAAVRITLRPADREGRPLALDRPFTPPCAAGARPGDLGELSFAPVKLPGRGRTRVAMQLVRDGRPRLALDPAPVELGTVENAGRE